MEQFKVSEEDWQKIERLAKNPAAYHSRAVCELSDRVAALEAKRAKDSSKCPKTLEAFKQIGEYVKPRPLEECGKDHAVPSPAAAPAVVVPSHDELLDVSKPLVLSPEEGDRALFTYGYEQGYQQGLAAGRAEQQAAPEESSAAQSDPAMTALELPRDWYPDFADWLERQMPEGTVIGDPLWWASCIADWLIAKATLGPEPNLHDIALGMVDSLGRSFHVLPEILDTLRRAIREPMAEQQAAAEATPEPEPEPVHSQYFSGHGLIAGEIDRALAEGGWTPTPEPTPEPEPSPSPAADGGLVEEAVRAMRAAPLGYQPEARAAILRAAGWLHREGHLSAAALLEQEANR